MPGPLNEGRKGIPFTYTPTPVRGVGTTERLSTHRADDERLGEGFERSVVNRGDWRGKQGRSKKRRSR